MEEFIKFILSGFWVFIGFLILFSVCLYSIYEIVGLFFIRRKTFNVKNIINEICTVKDIAKHMKYLDMLYIKIEEQYVAYNPPLHDELSVKEIIPLIYTDGIPGIGVVCSDKRFKK